MSSEIIAVRRPLLVVEHQELRKNMPRTNREFPDVSIKWKRLGQVGLTLVGPDEYADLIKKERSQLCFTDPGEAVKRFNDEMKELPTEGGRLLAPTYGTGFRGDGQFLRIVYLLGDDVYDERERIIGIMDRENGVNGVWEEFDPELPIATIEAVHADDKVLGAFDSFRPETLTLLPAIASKV